MKTTVALLTLLSTATFSSAKTAPTEWFTQETSQLPAETLQRSIPTDRIEATRKLLFAAYTASQQASSGTFSQPSPLNPLNLSRHFYKIDDSHSMPYTTFSRGTRPEGGWPLVIAMHGGGKSPTTQTDPHGWDINTREWLAQNSLAASLYPDNCLYFVPRMVDDNNGRWWRDYNVTAYEALIKHAILHWDINPNKVYMLGISEGGYGTEVLASWMPDKLAAANGMACGSSTSVPLENLRNLPFRTDVGEHDTAFKRVDNVKLRHKILDELHAKSPDGYANHMEIQPGRGHGIDYQQGPAWLMQFTRNPHPQHITYTGVRNDTALRNSAYWLQCLNSLDQRYTYLDATSKDNTITISAKATKNAGEYLNPEWGAPRNNTEETVPATGLKLRIWLHESLVDFSKPISLTINGKTSTHTATPSYEALITSIKQFGDPNFAYPAFIDITVK